MFTYKYDHGMWRIFGEIGPTLTYFATEAAAAAHVVTLNARIVKRRG